MSLRRTLADPAARRLLASGFFAFVLVGALQAMYGPAFPALRARYGLGADQVALVVSLHFFGSFAAISLSGVLVRALGYRRVLVAAALLFAAGAFGVALSPLWSLTLAFALLAGLGFGALDVGVNMLFARAFEAKSAPALNLLNALFGVGAILGPLFVGAFLGALLFPFAVLGALAVALAALLGGIHDPPSVALGGPRLPLPYGRLVGFLLLYLFYVASEVGVASWETTQLEPHLGPAAAARLPAIYWAAMTLGRFVAAPLSSRLRAADLVLGAALLALAGVALASATPLAPYAYALVGFAFAPIFPTGLTWLQQTFPRRAEQVMPVVVAGANLGPVLGSWLIGLVVARTSPDAVPLALLALVVPLAAFSAGLWWRTRQG